LSARFSGIARHWRIQQENFQNRTPKSAVRWFMFCSGLCFADSVLLKKSFSRSTTIRHTIWKFLLLKIDWTYTRAKSSKFQLGPVIGDYSNGRHARSTVVNLDSNR
jgi:hypothetical protein